jgi:uncharacterized protein
MPISTPSSRPITPSGAAAATKVDTAIWFDPATPVSDCRDPKDHKYLELALAAGAETIVTSDYDLLILHPWRRVRLLMPADYLALL